MPRKRKRPAETSSKGSRSAAKNKKRSNVSVSRHDTSRNRIAGFDLLRLRRAGLPWKDAEQQAAISRHAAQNIFPRAFFFDERGRLQVREYDPYTRKLKISTTRPGEFRWLRARGSHKASLVGTWNNAVKAAGRGDFSLIDAFPHNVFINGVRLPTSHLKVSRIAAAAAESDEPFEDIYSFVGAA
jgi:hypothetical protein